jgi:hypothetical protein
LGTEREKGEKRRFTGVSLQTCKEVESNPNRLACSRHLLSRLPRPLQPTTASINSLISCPAGRSGSVLLYCDVGSRISFVYKARVGLKRAIRQNTSQYAGWHLRSCTPAKLCYETIGRSGRQKTWNCSNRPNVATLKSESGSDGVGEQRILLNHRGLGDVQVIARRRRSGTSPTACEE